MDKKIIIFIFFFTACINLNAQKISIDSLKQVVSLNNKDTNTVIAFRMLAGLVVHQNQQEAINYAKRGVDLGKQLDWDKGIAGCYLNIAVAFGFASQFDSAFVYQDSALVYAYKVGEPKRLALLYLNKADLYMQLHIFDKSLQYCDSSSIYAELANSDDRRARIFQTIGSVYYYQELYDKSIEYYTKSLDLYNTINNLAMSSIVISNLSNIYKKQKKYDEALSSLNKAIKIGDSINDLNNMSMHYSNMGDVYFEMGKFGNAERYYLQAMEFSKEQSDSNDLARLNAQLADVNLNLNNISEAIRFASIGYGIANRNKYLEQEQNSSGVLGKAFYRNGDYKLAYEYFNIHKTINDSINKQRFNADIVAMQTRFDVTQKEKDIAEKVKDIQLLNDRSTAQQESLRRKNIINYLLFAAIILVGFSAFTIYNRYKLKQRLKEVQLRNNIAADLHDDIGSTLSSIRMYSDIVNDQIKDKTPDATILLSKISNNSKEMIDNMSDIVWAIKPSNDVFENINNRMFNFATELCNAKGIELNMQRQPELDAIKIDMEERRDLYLIFKESVNNAVKYSEAACLIINFNKDNGGLSMNISDNGNGFDINTKSFVKGGNGLENMKRRAEAHNWKLTIKSETGKGTDVDLNMRP